MNSNIKTIPSIRSTYHSCISAIAANTAYFAPFIVFFLFEFSALILILLAPRAPFNGLMAPPIRAKWGEEFLHYPANFLLLPKLGAHAHTVITFLYGPIMSGAAISLICASCRKEKLPVFSAFMKAVKKYLQLFFIVASTQAGLIILIRLIYKGIDWYFHTGNTTLLYMDYAMWKGKLINTITFILMIAAQMLFVYSAPVLLIRKAPLGRAILASWNLCRKYFFQTLALVGIPSLLFAPALMLLRHSPAIIGRILPEAVFFICAGGAFLNAIIIDALITGSTAVFFLEINET